MGPLSERNPPGPWHWTDTRCESCNHWFPVAAERPLKHPICSECQETLDVIVATRTSAHHQHTTTGDTFGGLGTSQEPAT
jgi:hypothetical protein